MTEYQVVFSRQACEFAVEATSAELRDLRRLATKLERMPGIEGDFTEFDESGRELQVITWHFFAVIFWADHSTREIRIVRIERADG